AIRADRAPAVPAPRSRRATSVSGTPSGELLRTWGAAPSHMTGEQALVGGASAYPPYKRPSPDASGCLARAQVDQVLARELVRRPLADRQVRGGCVQGNRRRLAGPELELERLFAIDLVRRRRRLVPGLAQGIFEPIEVVLAGQARLPVRQFPPLHDPDAEP